MQINLLDTISDPGMKNGKDEKKGVKRIVNGRIKDTRFAIFRALLAYHCHTGGFQGQQTTAYFSLQILYTSSKGMDGWLHTALHWRLDFDFYIRQHWALGGFAKDCRVCLGMWL